MAATVEQILALHGYVHGPDHNGIHAVFDRNGGCAGYFRAHEVLGALNLKPEQETT